MVVSKKLLEGCVSSNLDRCSVHCQVLRSTKIRHEILECITNTFIIGLGNVTNSIESQFVAEDLAANISCE